MWASTSSYGKRDDHSDNLTSAPPRKGREQCPAPCRKPLIFGPCVCRFLFLAVLFVPAVLTEGVGQSSAYRLPLPFAKTTKPKIPQGRTLHLYRCPELRQAGVSPACQAPLRLGRMWGPACQEAPSPLWRPRVWSPGNLAPRAVVTGMAARPSATVPCS